MVRKFLHSEIFKVWIQYCAAMVLMIPAGILYVVMLRHNFSERISFVIATVVALSSGFIAWFTVDRRMRRPALAVVQVSTRNNIVWQDSVAYSDFALGNIPVRVSSLGFSSPITLSPVVLSSYSVIPAFNSATASA